MCVRACVRPCVRACVRVSVFKSMNQLTNLFKQHQMYVAPDDNEG